MASKTVGIKSEVLNDLASRFLINIPDEDKDDPVKLCSHVELAYWFYLDLQRPEDPSLPACSMKEFMATIFRHCPFLIRESVAKDLDTLIAQWKTHKYSRPIRGAIILDQNLTKCLLVQGYPASTSWGFPKGKLEQGENDRDSAVREVYEETGFDIRDLIREEWALEAHVNENTAKMYIIPGVPDDTDFAPRTRKEIRAIQWFRIEDLPRHKKDLTSKQALGKNANSFFMIIPFMNLLRRWIVSYQQKTRGGNKPSQRTKASHGMSVSASFHPPENPLPQRSATSPAVMHTTEKPGSGLAHPSVQPQQQPQQRVPVPSSGAGRSVNVQSGPGSIPPKPYDTHAGTGIEWLLPRSGGGGPLGDGMGTAHSGNQPAQYNSPPLLGTPISYHPTAPHGPQPPVPPRRSNTGPLLPTPVLHGAPEGPPAPRSSAAPLLATLFRTGAPTSRVTLLPNPHTHPQPYTTAVLPYHVHPVPIDYSYSNQRVVYPSHVTPVTMTAVTRVTATEPTFNPIKVQTSLFNPSHSQQQDNQWVVPLQAVIQTSTGQQQPAHYRPGPQLQPSQNFQKFVFNKELILACLRSSRA